ncbi:MAG: hypothetical protein WBG64_00055, partial [Thermoanaerobaculia bacterium]
IWRAPHGLKYDIDRMIDITVLVGFLILLIAIGRWAAGNVHTSLDYHLAGRRLGKWPVALSLARPPAATIPREVQSWHDPRTVPRLQTDILTGGVSWTAKS